MLILARLYVQRISEALNPSSEICLTDSTVALSWIRSTKKRYKQYVENRVKEIRQIADVEDWYHVPGKDNPADLPSLGCLAEELHP